MLNALQASSGSSPYPKSWLGICLLHFFPFGDRLVSSFLKLTELMPLNSSSTSWKRFLCNMPGTLVFIFYFSKNRKKENSLVFAIIFLFFLGFLPSTEHASQFVIKERSWPFRYRCSFLVPFYTVTVNFPWNLALYWCCFPLYISWRYVGFQFLEGQASWVGESILPEHLISFLHYSCLFRKKCFTFFLCKKQTVDLLFQIPISINELFYSLSLLNKSLFLKKLSNLFILEYEKAS